MKRKIIDFCKGTSNFKMKSVFFPFKKSFSDKGSFAKCFHPQQPRNPGTVLLPSPIAAHVYCALNSLVGDILIYNALIYKVDNTTFPSESTLYCTVVLCVRPCYVMCDSPVVLCYVYCFIFYVQNSP